MLLPIRVCLLNWSQYEADEWQRSTSVHREKNRHRLLDVLVNLGPGLDFARVLELVCRLAM